MLQRNFVYMSVLYTYTYISLENNHLLRINIFQRNFKLCEPYSSSHLLSQ